MHPQAVTCTSCRAILPSQTFNLGVLTACPSCSARLRVDVFPALFRPIAVNRPENVLVEGESSCFYHSQNKAVIPCDGCGRFLCALCDIELNGGHYCPNCLESGQKKGVIKSLDSRRTMFDSIALSLAIVPLLCIWPSILTAPIALFMAIRYRNHPTSIVRRSKARCTVAAILASLQIIGWIVFFVVVSTR